MDLNSLWFILIAVLFIGFFVLEGFDFGVGMLLPFLGTDDLKRRVIINTIGPHWDGNEVWLITAGGAMFAAFPEWYATLFSGLYLPLALVLLGLIARGVAFEFRSKHDDPRWRSLWDACIFLGSFLPALLLGLAFTNLLVGLPIDADRQYVGGFFNLLGPYALLGGVTAVVAFVMYGAIFLSLKTTGELQAAARAAARRFWLINVATFVAFVIYTYLVTDIVQRLGVNPGALPLTAVAGLLLVGYFLSRGREGWAFLMEAVSIIFTFATFFLILFPRVLISNLDPAYSLTIYTASSSPYTLRVMTVIALTFVPIVLAYQAWTYWVFRKRLEAKPETLTY